MTGGESLHRGKYGTVGGIPVPRPVPPIVKNGFLVTALSVGCLVFPMAALVGFGGGALLDWVNSRLGTHLSVPLTGVMLITFACTAWPPMYLAYSRTSSFILECVKWYLDHDDVESAKRFALRVDYQVWYREWKRNPWFRRFAVENGLVERSGRYAKFNRKLPAAPVDTG